MNFSQGKQLNPRMLLAAYSNGYFPMPDETNSEIAWYRPDPRAIIPIDAFHVSRSLRKVLRKNIFSVTIDRAFGHVMEKCSEREETWISPEIKAAYAQLYLTGHAKSIEVWHEGNLAGGLYGVSIGGAFFAESMFHRMPNASKVALFYLIEGMKSSGMKLLECQFLTEHLASLGAITVPDHVYMKLLKDALQVQASLQKVSA